MNQKHPCIVDVYPLKAQFLQGEPIVIAVEVANPFEAEVRIDLVLRVSCLDETEDVLARAVDLPARGVCVTSVGIYPKGMEYAGYGVDVHLYEDGLPRQIFSSSFDVVSDWRQATRYGFLCDFHADERGNLVDVVSLCKLHLNLVQFYDWMYRHDELVPPTDRYKDPLGRELSLEVVKEKVDCCHRHGMKAFAYGAVYAASKGFYCQHEDWALYDSAGKAHNLAGLFYIMNPTPGSPWHDHILAEYAKAIERVDFDGIHMDTYGFPKTGFSKRDGTTGLERLDEIFPAFIGDARRQLREKKRDIGLFFNAVGNWPIEALARSELDALYIEVWPPYERYNHLRQLIAEAKRLGKGMPVILAAYLGVFAADGQVPAEQAETSALVLTAVIGAHGGYHLLLGEDRGILTEGYYVKYARMGDEFFRIIRDYYDFLVRYACILHDNDLKDVSMTHAGGENSEYGVENVDFSTYGEAGKVWAIIREKPERKAVSLINFTGMSDDLWNRGKNRPSVLENILLKMEIVSEVKRVYQASPDIEMGRPRFLAFSIEEGRRGRVLCVQVPALYLWTLVVVELV